jgi:hypothetical protein
MAESRYSKSSILYDLTKFLEVTPADQKAQESVQVSMDCLSRVFGPANKTKAEASSGSPRVLVFEAAQRRRFIQTAGTILK